MCTGITAPMRRPVSLIAELATAPLSDFVQMRGERSR